MNFLDILVGLVWVMEISKTLLGVGVAILVGTLLYRKLRPAR